MGDANITIPEEAWALLISEPSVEETERAAALIVAAELERTAKVLNTRAVARHQIGADNGDECDEDCEANDCHTVSAVSVYLMTRDRLLRRAADLRGSLTHKGEETQP